MSCVGEKLSTFWPDKKKTLQKLFTTELPIQDSKYQDRNVHLRCMCMYVCKKRKKMKNSRSSNGGYFLRPPRPLSIPLPGLVLPSRLEEGIPVTLSARCNNATYVEKND